MRQRNQTNSTIRVNRATLSDQVAELRDYINSVSQFDDDCHQEIYDRLDDQDRRLNELYWYAFGASLITVVVVVCLLVRAIINYYTPGG